MSKRIKEAANSLLQFKHFNGQAWYKIVINMIKEVEEGLNKFPESSIRDFLRTDPSRLPLPLQGQREAYSRDNNEIRIMRECERKFPSILNRLAQTGNYSPHDMVILNGMKFLVESCVTRVESMAGVNVTSSGGVVGSSVEEEKRNRELLLYLKEVDATFQGLIEAIPVRERNAGDRRNSGGQSPSL